MKKTKTMNTTSLSSSGWRTFTLPLGDSGSTFDLEKAVCSHGFFMMAPNRWDSSTKTLQRPFRLFSDSTISIIVRIDQPSKEESCLRVQVPCTLSVSSCDQEVLLSQVARMLRISERDERDIRRFHEIHPGAKVVGFGRIFCSPTLFEDIVKSILLCSCGWGRSLEMSRALCEVQLELKGGGPLKHDQFAIIHEQCGDFPTSKELANVNEHFLKKKCNLGYRAEIILKLVGLIERGKLRLTEWRVEDIDVRAACKSLTDIKGIGPFIQNYVLTCMGSYDRIPLDSETVGHIKKVHKRKSCNARTVEKDATEIYKKYAPFQYLAYWFELWYFYEEQFGKLSELPPDSYRLVTGTLKRKEQASTSTSTSTRGGGALKRKKQGSTRVGALKRKKTRQNQGRRSHMVALGCCRSDTCCGCG